MSDDGEDGDPPTPTRAASLEALAQPAPPLDAIDAKKVIDADPVDEEPLDRDTSTRSPRSGLGTSLAELGIEPTKFEARRYAR